MSKFLSRVFTVEILGSKHSEVDAARAKALIEGCEQWRDAPNRYAFECANIRVTDAYSGAPVSLFTVWRLAAPRAPRKPCFWASLGK